MKKILLIAGLFIIQHSYAQNVIYKCTTTTGETTYQNNVGDKSECTKTNFASFPNINFFKQEASKNKTTNTSSVTSNSMKTTTSSPIISDEQRIRDSKRALILTQELNQEKEQLSTVSLMLKNLKDSNSKDSAQISQLEELKNSHSNNINAIERELGNTKNIVKSEELKIEKAVIDNPSKPAMMVTTAITPNGNKLPLSLPQSLPTPIPVVIKKDISNKNISPILKKEEVKTTANIESKIKNDTKSSEKVIASTTNSQLDDKRKKNNLGSSTNYASGLSGMSKIKN